MGEFLKRELTIGQCDPASDAFFSRNKDSSVYINKWYSDYRSKQCAFPQNLLCQVTILACFPLICYEKWPVPTKNKKGDLQGEGESSDRNFNYLALINWSIFYCNFMVTVLSSVEHGCSDWSTWLEKNFGLQYDPSPHKTIDRGA